MRHSKCAPSLPVTYHPSPRSLTCSPLTYQLSPRSGASGYQNRVHKKHGYLITCPQYAILAAFLSDRLITWASTARSRLCRLFASHHSPALAQRRHLFPAISRRLSPPLLFTFHLTPALAQRGTLPNPSAHTLAIWQSAPGAIQTPLLSVKPATTWQSGKLPIQPKYAAYYQTPYLPPTKAVCSISLPSCPLAPSIPRSLDPSRPARAPRPGLPRPLITLSLYHLITLIPPLLASRRLPWLKG